MVEQLKSVLEKLDINLDKIVDKEIKEAILQLFQIIEDLVSTVRDVQIENQKLRDEISHLKGEQGKPKYK